jgi:hypothetical protein
MADIDSRSATLAEDKEARRSISPTPPGSLNKELNSKIDDSTTDNEDGSFKESSLDEINQDDIEYPSGVRLALIVVSLLLSIFLVRFPPSSI